MDLLSLALRVVYHSSHQKNGKTMTLCSRCCLINLWIGLELIHQISHRIRSWAHISDDRSHFCKPHGSNSKVITSNWKSIHLITTDAITSSYVNTHCYDFRFGKWVGNIYMVHSCVHARKRFKDHHLSHGSQGVSCHSDRIRCAIKYRIVICHGLIMNSVQFF